MSVRIANHYVPLPSFILMLVEGAIAVAALFLVTSRLGTELPAAAMPGWRTIALFVGLFISASIAMGLYNVRLRVSFMGLSLRFALMALMMVLGILVTLKAFPVADRVTLADYAQAILVTVCASLIFRFLLGELLGNGFLKTRVLVYGAGHKAQSIAKLRRRSDRVGFTVVGYVAASGESPAVPQTMIADCGVDLLGYCEEQDVDEIIVAMDDRRQSFPVMDLLNCRMNGIAVLDLAGFLERETAAVLIDVVNPSWFIFSPGFRHSRFDEAVGRAFDVAASLALLSLTWPLMLIAAVFIKLEDGIRSPVLYRQQRVGKNGQVFELLKFRSMKIDAESDGVARWASEGDERVTAVGAFIRTSRIDELPQLWNILRGEMRFVGPRPERPEFVNVLAKKLPYYCERHSVAPGLTGWAQLRFTYGASENDALEKLKYDLYYVKNRSLILDLSILLQTVEVILFGRGAR